MECKFPRPDDEREVAEGIVLEAIPKKPTFVEMMLSPQTLRGLMSLGGALLVVGLVVWLWSVGFFDNPVTVATVLGVANAAVLAAGGAVFQYTRHKTAGRALTLLGCVVMPLNLWFYDAQGLITLDQGGHLWVPALVCCAVYAGVARLLKDPTFVYTLAGGVTLTGLLFLADAHVGRFWEVTAPSTLLVVLGMIFIHAERFFPAAEGPFSRKNFGLAFFRSGHVVMALGLVVLLVGRLAGRLYDPWLADFGLFVRPEVMSLVSLKLVALMLALGATYSYVYSQVVVEAKGQYVYSAVLTLLWCGVIVLDLLQIPLTLELVMLLTAGCSIAANVAGLNAAERKDSGEKNEKSLVGASLAPLGRAGVSVASGLTVLVVAMAASLYLRARIGVVHELMPYDFSGWYVLATLGAAAACGVGAWVHSRLGRHVVSSVHTGALAVTGLFTAAGALTLVGCTSPHVYLPIEMLLPLAALGMAVVTRGTKDQKAWLDATTLSAALLLGVGGIVAFGWIYGGVTGSVAHLLMGVFFLESVAAFAGVAMLSGQKAPTALATVAGCGAVWELLLFAGFVSYTPILAGTVVGTLCVAAGRTGRFSGLEYPGRAIFTLASVAALLLTLARLLTGECEWSLVPLLVGQIGAGMATIVLSKEKAWRHHFMAVTALQVIALLLVLNTQALLTLVQKGELMLTLAGAAMVVGGYIGWAREGDSRDDLVSLNFGLGSLLVAVPSVLGLAALRFFGAGAGNVFWASAHEIGVLIVGLLLLGSGVVCRVRWTTIGGGAMLAGYLATLLGLVTLPDQLQTAAVYMMIGGGAFFGTAVLLSVYRDRLMEIPERARKGEGVFRVLKWR